MNSIFGFICVILISLMAGLIALSNYAVYHSVWCHRTDQGLSMCEENHHPLDAEDSGDCGLIRKK